jgi:hypothetical protein
MLMCEAAIISMAPYACCVLLVHSLAAVQLLAMYALQAICLLTC